MKGWRKIVVDGVEYRWRLGKTGMMFVRYGGGTTCCPVEAVAGLSLEEAERAARKDLSVAAGDVAEWIRGAKRKGEEMSKLVVLETPDGLDTEPPWFKGHNPWPRGHERPGVRTVSRRLRDLFRQRFWVRCLFCDYRAGPFHTEEQQSQALFHRCGQRLDPSGLVAAMERTEDQW